MPAKSKVKVGQRYEDRNRHDGRKWVYRVVALNAASVRVEPCDPATLIPVGEQWRYTIRLREFSAHTRTGVLRHRVMLGGKTGPSQ